MKSFLCDTFRKNFNGVYIEIEVRMYFSLICILDSFEYKNISQKIQCLSTHQGP